jgi:hypothetical protein
MSVDKMSVDKMSVDKMSVDKISVDKMSVDKMTVYRMPCCHQCDYQWLPDLFPTPAFLRVANHDVFRILADVLPHAENRLETSG